MNMIDFNPNLDLSIERNLVELKPAQIWRAWTDPESLKNWFCPRPWKTIECEMDLRPGGIFKTVMQSPDGENFPNLGCFLEIIENKRLVWTDALGPGFRPVTFPESGAGLFLTALIILEEIPEGTKYLAISKHKDEKDRQKHKDMGFHEGWNIVVDQLLEHLQS